MSNSNKRQGKTPLVTIAIPTYNRADGYLKDAINSALSQTYGNIEIIVSDNCSEDNTKEIVENFRDSRIRYFRHEKNIGANNNFNFCLNQAQGKYFMLLSDDDLIDADMIETCITAEDGKSAGIISTGVRIIDGTGRNLRENTNPGAGLSMFDYLIAWLEGRIPFYMCSTLYHAKKLIEYGGFYSKTNLYQDVAAAFSLMADSGRLDIYDVKASFRTHQGNRGSKVRINEWCDDSIYILKLMSDLVGDNSDVLLEKGKKVLVLRNYRKASKIRSPIERHMSYWNINKKFDGCYSPIKYLFESNLKKKINFK